MLIPIFLGLILIISEQISGEGMLKRKLEKKEYNELPTKEHDKSPPIDIPLYDIITDDSDFDKGKTKVSKDDSFVVGSYNPKKNDTPSLIENMEEPINSELLGDQNKEVVSSDNDLFFGDIEL